MSAYSSPYDMKNSYSTLSNKVNGPVTASVLGHLIVLFLIIFGIPFVAKNPEVLYEPVPVEIISSSDLDSQKDPVEPAEAKPEPPPIVEKAPTMVEEQPPKPEPVKEPVIEEVKPEPSVPPPPIETPESEVAEEEPEQPIILPTRKPKPPEPKKVEKPKEEIKPKNDMNALLKNLAESEPAPTVQAAAETEQPTPKEGISAGRLSYGEIDSVRAQLNSCWNFPAGAKYAENLVVQLNLVMNTDRTVRSAKVVDQSKYNRDPAFRAAADAAMRAVRNPRCDPLKLPPAKYNEWKTITLNFDPRGVL